MNKSIFFEWINLKLTNLITNFEFMNEFLIFKDFDSWNWVKLAPLGNQSDAKAHFNLIELNFKRTNFFLNEFNHKFWINQFISDIFRLQ